MTVQSRIAVRWDDGISGTALFSYDPADPFAVTVLFAEGSDDPKPWRFARSLLADGLDAPVGIGDVRVWPWAGDRVCVRIGEEGDTATCSMQVVAVRRFLFRTYAAVPPGTETVDLSGLIALLRGAW